MGWQYLTYPPNITERQWSISGIETPVITNKSSRSSKKLLLVWTTHGNHNVVYRFLDNNTAEPMLRLTVLKRTPQYIWWVSNKRCHQSAWDLTALWQIHKRSMLFSWTRLLSKRQKASRCTYNAYDTLCRMSNDIRAWLTYNTPTCSRGSDNLPD